MTRRLTHVSKYVVDATYRDSECTRITWRRELSNSSSTMLDAIRTYELAIMDGNGNVIRPPERQGSPLFDQMLHEIMQGLEEGAKVCLPCTVLGST